MTLRYTKPPSQRQLRVSEVIRAEISTLFSRGILVHYGLEKAIISVSEVRISSDLKMATAFLAPTIDGDKARMLPILEPLATEIRRIITPKLNLRFSPQIRLVFDEASGYADSIEKMLQDLKTSK